MNVPVRTAERGAVIESVIAKGDLSKLTSEERTQYYVQLCQSMGLNPHTQPFAFLTLNGKLTLYAKRDAADQLRKLNGISIQIVGQKVTSDLLSIHVRAQDKTGRQDEDYGVVPFPETLKGEARANAILKAVTKAKRRVTLSISGLGFLSEEEAEDVAAARPGPPLTLPPHDPATGEVNEAPANEDGEETITEKLERLDNDLAAAAEKGIAELQQAWRGLTTEEQSMLKGALDRRHKFAAAKADEEARRE